MAVTPNSVTPRIMPTIRVRGDTVQAIARVKKGGVLIFQDSQSFPLNGQPESRIRRIAREWAAAKEAEVRRNGAEPEKLKAWTLAELLEEQVKELNRHGTPRRTKVAELEQLQAHFVKDKLASLTSHTFTKFAAKRRAEGAGPTTILHNLTTMRAVLNAAKPLHGLSINGDVVAEAIKALSTVGAVAKSASRERRPTDVEWGKLMDYFDRMAYHPTAEIPMRQVCELAVALPRRLGELTDALWENHNKERHVLTLLDTKHPTKIRNEVVPLPVAARHVLSSLPVIDARILPYKAESVSAAFQRACRRCGIDDLHFHDLRHHGISKLFEMGLSIPEVAVISGHLSWQMLKRYTHLGTSALMEKLNGNAQGSVG
jgi:integrase